MLRFAPALLLFALCAEAQPPAAPKLRLPDTVRPVSYSVNLRVTPGQDDFSGRVAIDIDVLREAPVIWLHSKELVFTSVRAGSSEARAEAAANDFVAITPASPLPRGRSTLVIDYTGKISRTLTDGIFQQQDNGDWYIFTKFEPVTARRAFPCFDEPGFKTPWQLTVRVPANGKAFSNTPVLSETPAPDGTKTVQFARTKPLPSYLVVLAVGPFDTVDVAPMGRKRVPGRIIVPRGRAAEAAYAAEVTPKAVQFLEDYFGIPYPYEKLDQVVVPLTTAWGAMENAGMVAYGQFLLVKKGEDTTSRERSRLSTMVHEISHQWVGNLVTTKWWDDIWLNEGFAVWITSKIMDRWHPEWNAKSSAVGSTNAAMSADSLVSARKVRQPIEAPGDIGNAFDGITYMKGAAVLRMTEAWIGEATFQKGLRKYLTRHAWGNATTPELLTALSEASGRDIRPAFSSFLDQTGVPLVKAEVRCGEGKPALRLTQERFLPVGSEGSTSATWTLPVCFRWSDGKAQRRECVVLSDPSRDFAIRKARACPAWLFASDNASGYYRSLYAGDGFDRLLESGLDRLTLHEKTALLQNVQALVAAGKFDAGQALSLAMRFSDSEERDIVTTSIRIVNTVASAIHDTRNAEYAQFIREWLGPRSRKLGWRTMPGDSEDVKAIRLAVVPLVAIGGEDAELGAEARRLAAAWLKDRSAVDRDSAGIILVAAARHSGREFFDQLVSALRTTKDQYDRYAIIAGLGAFRDPELIRSALDLILNPGDGIEPREVRSIISGQWRETRDTVWDYVRKNFDALNAKLPGARGIPYGATLPSAASAYCDAGHASEVEAFFRPRIGALPGGDRNLARVLEGIRLCEARKKVLEPGAIEFLKREKTAHGRGAADAEAAQRRSEK